MSSLTVNVNDQSYTGHQIRPTVKDSNNNTQITAKLGTVNIDLGQFTISYPDSKDANKEVGTGTLTLAPKASNKNFTGSKEVSFKIVGQKIIWSNDVANAFKVYDANGKEVNVANQSFIYYGKAHTFASATFNYSYTDPITHKTVKLEEGKDFEIKYFHNVTGNASHEAYIAVVGKGNYAGNNDTTNQVFEDENGQKVNAITYKKFTITPVQLSDQNVTVSNGTYAEGSVSVVVMNGNVKVPTEKYVVTENADGTVTVTPAKDSKYYIGSKTVTLAGSEANEKPGTPMISNVKVVGNKATVILSGDTDGAAGYDYVISTDRDCITNKDYTSVNKNQVQTSTTFK